MAPSSRSTKSVFSAHAEVVPTPSASSTAGGSILRARGGSSNSDPTDDSKRPYSPRTRR